MQNVRSSVRFAGTDFLRVLAVAAAAVLTVCPAAHAQPILRIGAGGEATIRGAEVHGGPAFPAAALERLGFTLTSVPGAVTAVVGADTVRFWDTSPWFMHGRTLHHLAFAPGSASGILHLPEQLFIQWLPSAMGSRFVYRNGVLERRDAVAVRTPQAGPAAARSDTPGAGPVRAIPAPPAPARVVVIDPGHGGVDPGRIGPNGLREKDVTLRVSRRLADALAARGYEVHLTRDSDTLIALADRSLIANRLRADRPGALFLSIHANAATAASARGFETFFLSDARTEDERRVAEMENEAVRYEAAAPAATRTGLDQVLAGLHSDFLTRASHDLAAVMQDRLARFHPGPNRGVKRAGFLVLVGSVMPAVLIETAFISNRDEAALLGDAAFQQKLADAIADGVDEFFRRNEHLWVQRP